MNYIHLLISLITVFISEINIHADLY